MWFLSLLACPAEPTAVGVTLGDGQVVVGEITTDELRLKGAYGEVSMPLEDVGLVLPVEGQTLSDSHAHVTVWLRNGSELTGQWTEPELEMSFLVGGAMHPIDIPTDKLQAMQLRTSESWPSDGSYRVKTTHGDDFLVDAEKTTITVKSVLGQFGVTLAECLSVGPVGDPTGDWRFTLATGTVIIGKPAEEKLQFALPMGPEHLEVPLASLVSLNRNIWYEQSGSYASPVEALPEAPAQVIAPQADVDMPLNIADLPAGAGGQAQAPKARARAALPRDGGWFQNDLLEQSKR